MSEPQTIVVPLSLMDLAVHNDRSVIVIKEPDKFDDTSPLSLKCALSHRQWAVINPRIFKSDGLDIPLSTLFQALGDDTQDKAGKELLRASPKQMKLLKFMMGDILNVVDKLLKDMQNQARDSMQHAYSTSNIYGYDFLSDPHLTLHFDRLDPIPPAAAPESDATMQFMSLGQEQFSNLFFIRDSEAWAADKEKRDPIPAKTGSIRSGSINYTPGPLRLIETDRAQNPTGWEAVTVIERKTNIQKRPLGKIEDHFIKASGFNTDREFAQQELIELYQGLGKPITLQSRMTAVIFKPVSPNSVTFNPQATATHMPTGKKQTLDGPGMFSPG